MTASSPSPSPSPTPTPSSGVVITGLRKTFGTKTVVHDLDLEIKAGELVSLLGPSGCGKTTTLRMVAGFLAADAGDIVIDGSNVIGLPPERRPSAMVFQNYALWPHMSVFNNVAYPLKIKRRPKAEVVQRVEQALSLVNLMHHRNSRPATISGGEQQRVALARALVQEPKVLLLDEPLSNLDAKLRVRVREDIRTLQQELGITTLLVTHDQDEALGMSDRIAVMNDGRIEQVSTPQELYAEPQTEFVANFVGSLNSMPGRWGVSGLIEEEGLTTSVRPEDVILSTHAAPSNGPDGSGGSAIVQHVVPRGHFCEVVLDFSGTTIRAFVDRTSLMPGDTTAVSFRRTLQFRDGRRSDPQEI